MIECFMIVLFLYFDCNRNYVCEMVNDCVYVVLIIENQRWIFWKGRDLMLEGRLLFLKGVCEIEKKCIDNMYVSI